ncbi:MAG: glycine zipper 2TM domain-containing protein [Campylobacteraceae bacterium]|nr:glycine zipper 2TM domain-containing protein [Campylobacteraceae bacterium]
MKKFLTIISLVVMFIFVGCVNSGNPSYSGKNYSQIKEILVGDIIEVRNVSIEGEGLGTVLGAVIGGVIGSTMGGGRGSTLTTLGGAVAGGFAGNQLGKTAAQELVVTLDSGKDIVVISKGTNFSVGERIRIIKNGNEVASVKRVIN